MASVSMILSPLVNRVPGQLPTGVRLLSGPPKLGPVNTAVRRRVSSAAIREARVPSARLNER